MALHKVRRQTDPPAYENWRSRNATEMHQAGIETGQYIVPRTTQKAACFLQHTGTEAHFVQVFNKSRLSPVVVEVEKWAHITTWTDWSMFCIFSEVFSDHRRLLLPPPFSAENGHLRQFMVKVNEKDSENDGIPQNISFPQGINTIPNPDFQGVTALYFTRAC